MPELGSYDPNAAPAEVFDPIPPGKYIAIITESDVVTPSSGKGRMLSLKWEICDGEYGGRKLFSNINLENPSQQAQEIGQRQLASLRLATGKNSPRASEEFHGIPIEITVKIRPAGPDKQGIHREAQNEIKGYAKVGSDAPQQVAAQQPAAKPQAATVAAGASGGKPPWQR